MGEPKWPRVVPDMAVRHQLPDATGNEKAFSQWQLSLRSAPPLHQSSRWAAAWPAPQGLPPTGDVINLFAELAQCNSSEQALATTEAQLRLWQDRLEAVLHALPDLWMVLDHDGRCLQCPVDRHPLLPSNFSRLIGSSVQEVFPDSLGERIYNALQALKASGEPQRLEAEFASCADDQQHTVEVRLSPMPNGQALFLTRDLTELNVLRRDVDLLERVLEADVSLPLLLVDASTANRQAMYCNPAFEYLMGVRRANLLGQDWRVLIEPSNPNQIRLGALGQAMLVGHSATVVLEHDRNGRRMLAEWHMSPVRDSHDHVSHFIFVVKDVTEQVRAADKLRVSEELYRSVAAAISDGLMVVTLDGRVAAVNPAACRILGAKQEDLLGQREPFPFALLDSNLQPSASTDLPVRRVLQRGIPVVDEVHAVKRSSGELRWLSMSCHPLRLNPDDLLFSAVVTFRDITDTREAARALRLSEERWNFALEGAGQGVWDWDLQTNRTFYSHQWKALLGYAEGEISDSTNEGQSRIHPEDRQAAIHALNNYLSGTTPVYQAEYRIRHKDGHDLWVLDCGKAVACGYDGQPTRMVGTLSDITQRRAAEQALCDKQAAELANQAKSQFLSRMSHEMRTPLNAMLGFAQLIKLEPSSGSELRAGYIEHILQAGQHLLALVNDVLDLQRVEEGRLALDIRPVELHRIMASCMDLLGPQAETLGVRFDCSAEPGLFVVADPRRLRQIFLNVGSNAVKYNRPGGRVRWVVDHVGIEHITMFIEDEGAGMTPEQVTRLFQPFERLGKETSTIEGTGLGLIIARGLVEEMGGTLTLSSRPGVGTKITIELPRHLAMKSDAADAWPHEAHDALPLGVAAVGAIPSPAGGAPLKLLYVEDNRINALLFEQALTVHSNIELKVAEDGQQALEIAQCWRPDVLVLDAHLPGISGFDALVALRQLPGLHDTPAYMCSADAMPEDVDRALDAGFEGYWTKPIDIAQVLTDLGRVANSLKRPSQT